MSHRPLVNKGKVDVNGIQEALKRNFPGTANVGGFIVCGYDTEGKICLFAEGTGGVDELRKHLKDDQVLYCMIRLPDKISIGDTIKDVFMSWAGPQVKRLERAKKKTNDHEFMKCDLMIPHHAALEVESLTNFNYDNIMAKSTGGSGSHILD